MTKISEERKPGEPSSGEKGTQEKTRAERSPQERLEDPWGMPQNECEKHDRDECSEKHSLRMVKKESKGVYKEKIKLKPKQRSQKQQKKQQVAITSDCYGDGQRNDLT